MNQKISELTAVSALTTTDTLPVVNGGSTKKVTVAQLRQTKYFIASSTAPVLTQASADYVCDGVADDVQINAAITALLAAGTGGGVIELSEGQFNLAASINLSSSFISVHGQGIGATLVKTQNNSNANPFNISGVGTIHINIRRMQIDCNRANNTFGSGIHINTPWQNYDAEHVFEDLLITNCNNNGVEAATSADTRAMFFSRVHVKGVSGNGFYFPWPSITDCIFEDCIADTVALNGFYQGGANNHHSNCKMFYCGSAGGNNHGFNMVGYNNYFENCEAQDNYQSGFYGDHTGGDTTYRNFGCTFVNCIADSNNQNADPLYGVGFQGIDVKQWQIIGGIAMTRPYPSFTQRIGVSFEGAATLNFVSGMFFFGNTTAYSDTTSSGHNRIVAGPDGNNQGLFAAAATTGAFTQMISSDAISITPTGDCTITAQGGTSGQRCTFIVTTSGTSTFVLTFGTRFKSTGTLSTGTVSGKIFTITFVYNGTNWCELGRTVAM